MHITIVIVIEACIINESGHYIQGMVTRLMLCSVAN